MQDRPAPTAEADAFLAELPQLVVIDMLVPDMSGILLGKQLVIDTLRKLDTKGARLLASNFHTHIDPLEYQWYLRTA